jgi:hypothetical protein
MNAGRVCVCFHCNNGVLALCSGPNRRKENSLLRISHISPMQTGTDWLGLFFNAGISLGLLVWRDLFLRLSM